MKSNRQIWSVWLFCLVVPALSGCGKMGLPYDVNGPIEHHETKLGEYVPTNGTLDFDYPDITTTQWMRGVGISRTGRGGVPSRTPATPPLPASTPSVLAVAAVANEYGCHLAQVVSDGGNFRVLWDGVPGPVFDSFLPLLNEEKMTWDGVPGPFFDNLSAFPSLSFSPDGRHLAYVAGVGGLAKVVIDLIPGTPFDPAPDLHPKFSANSQHIWYNAVKNGVPVFMLDGIEHLPGEMRSPVWSADGKHLAFKRGAVGNMSVVVDGQAGPVFNSISVQSPVFSPDGQHIAYEATNGPGRLVVVDGVAGPPFDSMVNRPVFSADSKHFGYIGENNMKTAVNDFAFIDGKPQKSYAGVRNLVFSPDGKHYAYFATDAITYVPYSADYFLVVDGVEGPKSAHPLTPDYLTFGANGKTAYIAYNGTDYFVQAGKTAGPSFQFIDSASIAFSRDGQHLAYYAQTGPTTAQVMLDGKPGPILDYQNHLSMPVFSPDGTHLAYPASIAGQLVVVLDGKPSPSLDMVPEPIIEPYGGRLLPLRDWPLVFSADSAHLAYRAGKNGKQFVMIDHKSGPEYDEIIAGPVRRKDGALEYLAAKTEGTHHVLVRVEVPNFSPAEK